MPYSSLLVLPFQEDSLVRLRRTTLQMHGMIFDAKDLCPRDPHEAKRMMPPRELLFTRELVVLVTCMGTRALLLSKVTVHYHM